MLNSPFNGLAGLLWLLDGSIGIAGLILAQLHVTQPDESYFLHIGGQIMDTPLHLIPSDIWSNIKPISKKKSNRFFFFFFFLKSFVRGVSNSESVFFFPKSGSSSVPFK